MRKEFVTSFWQRAYESLPRGAREQYLTQVQAAERWELTLGQALKAWSRARNAVLKALHTPRVNPGA